MQNNGSTLSKRNTSNSSEEIPKLFVPKDKPKNIKKKNSTRTIEKKKVETQDISIDYDYYEEKLKRNNKQYNEIANSIDNEKANQSKVIIPKEPSLQQKTVVSKEVKSQSETNSSSDSGEIISETIKIRPDGTKVRVVKKVVKKPISKPIEPTLEKSIIEEPVSKTPDFEEPKENNNSLGVSSAVPKQKNTLKENLTQEETPNQDDKPDTKKASLKEKLNIKKKDTKVIPNKTNEATANDETISEVSDNTIISNDIENNEKLNLISKAKETTATVQTFVENNSSPDKVLFNIKQGLNKLEDNRQEKKNIKIEKKVSFSEDSTQNYIPLKHFYEGFIVTTDNRYIGVIQCDASQFFKMTPAEQDYAMDNLKKIFQTPLAKVTIKVLGNEPSINEDLAPIRKKMETNPELLKLGTDMINKIADISSGSSYQRDYYFIFEYLGNERGVKQTEPAKIAAEMKVIKNTYKGFLKSCKCSIREFSDTTEENYFLADFLYKFFNRLSSLRVPFMERKMQADVNNTIYNAAMCKKKEIRAVDYIAPQCLYLDSKDHMYMDGFYYTFLTFKSDSYPSNTSGPWLSNFEQYGSCIDYDIITTPLPTERIKNALKKKNQVMYQVMRSNARSVRLGAEDKQEKLQNSYASTKLITSALDSGERMFNVMLLVTLRATSVSQLKEIKDNLTQFCLARLNGFKPVDAFLEVEEYFKMYMPFMYSSSLFNRNARNMTSEGVSSLFPFVQFKLHDKGGTVLGVASEYNSLASIDLFNSKYSNANMSIFGSSGSGKTFTQLMIAESLYLSGKRLWMILPKKGYEYKGLCNTVKGNYIRLVPGASNCINIFEITPQGTMDTSVLSENVDMGGGQSISWRAKKITEIVTWINLLFGEKDSLTSAEYTRLNTILAEFYNRYNITDNNDSIYLDKANGILKEMPTIGTFYGFLDGEDTLKRVSDLLEMFVYGQYKNFNGQTNIEMTSEFTVFDVDADDIPEEHLPAFIFMAFSYVTAKVREDVSKLDVLILDEYWKLLKTKESAKQVQDVVKIYRGYGGSVILATQEIADCLKNEEGASILNNTATNLLLKMKPNELDMVRKHIGLTDLEANKITDFDHEGMFVNSGEKTIIKIIPNQTEIKLFDTRRFDKK